MDDPALRDIIGLIFRDKNTRVAILTYRHQQLNIIPANFGKGKK